MHFLKCYLPGVHTPVNGIRDPAGLHNTHSLTHQTTDVDRCQKGKWQISAVASERLVSKWTAAGGRGSFYQDECAAEAKRKLQTG